MPTPPLPMHGVTPTHLEPRPAQQVERLSEAIADPDARSAVRRVAADHPDYLDAWAHLALLALQDDDPVAAYAFARTGYHRGLDAVRRAGWAGQGPVPWSHEPNRGFLRSVDALRRAADAIGEDVERDRCAAFLTELDPGGEAGREGGHEAGWEGGQDPGREGGHDAGREGGHEARQSDANQT